MARRASKGLRTRLKFKKKCNTVVAFDRNTEEVAPERTGPSSIGLLKRRWVQGTVVKAKVRKENRSEDYM